MRKQKVLMGVGLLLISMCIGCKGVKESNISTEQVDIAVARLGDTEFSRGIATPTYSFLDEYLKECNYISYTQTNSTYYEIEGNKESTITSIQQITLDFKDKTRKTVIEQDLKRYEFLENWGTNISLSRVEENPYVLDQKEVSVSYGFCMDVYEYLEYLLGVGNYSLNEEIKEKEIIYHFERDADSQDLVDVEYDKLGKTSIDVEVLESIPKRVKKRTEFYLGNVKYGIVLEYDIQEIGTKELVFPEYVKVEE